MSGQKQQAWIVRAGLGLALFTSHCGDLALPRVPVQGRAFAVVQQRFGPVLSWPGLAEPEVRWWTDLCPGTDTTAVVLGGRCYSGIYTGGSGVDVAWRGTIGTSAYSHELMHYYLQSLQGDSDPQHAQLPMWELVAATDTMLQNQGM